MEATPPNQKELSLGGSEGIVKTRNFGREGSRVICKTVFDPTSEGDRREIVGWVCSEIETCIDRATGKSLFPFGKQKCEKRSPCAVSVGVFGRD